MKKYEKTFKADFIVSVKRNGMCDRLPGTVLPCPYEYRCHVCEYAERLRLSRIYDPVPFPCVDENSVLPSKKGLVYYKKAVAVKPQTLVRLERKEMLYYQIFFCEDGDGCLPDNPVGYVDGYFLSEPDIQITLLRSDILGIPNLEVCKKYDRYFFANTVKACGHIKGGDVI